MLKKKEHVEEVKQENIAPPPLETLSSKDAGRFTYLNYKRIIPTKISMQVVPKGTKIEMNEGTHTCSEDSRIAIDVNGNIYPIAESVFKKSYERE